MKLERLTQYTMDKNWLSMGFVEMKVVGTVTYYVLNSLSGRHSMLRGI